MVVGVRLRSMHVAQNEKLSTIEAGEYAYNILHHGNEGSIMLGKVSRETLHTDWCFEGVLCVFQVNELNRHLCAAGFLSSSIIAKYATMSSKMMYEFSQHCRIPKMNLGRLDLETQQFLDPRSRRHLRITALPFIDSRHSTSFGLSYGVLSQ